MKLPLAFVALALSSTLMGWAAPLPMEDFDSSFIRPARVKTSIQNSGEGTSHNPVPAGAPMGSNFNPMYSNPGAGHQQGGGNFPPSYGNPNAPHYQGGNYPPGYGNSGAGHQGNMYPPSYGGGRPNAGFPPRGNNFPPGYGQPNMGNYQGGNYPPSFGGPNVGYQQQGNFNRPTFVNPGASHQQRVQFPPPPAGYGTPNVGHHLGSSSNARPPLQGGNQPRMGSQGLPPNFFAQAGIPEMGGPQRPTSRLLPSRRSSKIQSEDSDDSSFRDFSRLTADVEFGAPSPSMRNFNRMDASTPSESRHGDSQRLRKSTRKPKNRSGADPPLSGKDGDDYNFLLSPIDETPLMAQFERFSMSNEPMSAGGRLQKGTRPFERNLDAVPPNFEHPFNVPARFHKLRYNVLPEVEEGKKSKGRRHRRPSALKPVPEPDHDDDVGTSQGQDGEEKGDEEQVGGHVWDDSDPADQKTMIRRVQRLISYADKDLIAQFARLSMDDNIKGLLMSSSKKAHQLAITKLGMDDAELGEFAVQQFQGDEAESSQYE